MSSTSGSLTMDEKLSALQQRFGDYADIQYAEEGAEGTVMIEESTSAIIQGNGSDFPDGQWVEHWWHRNVFLSCAVGSSDERDHLIVTNDNRGLSPGYDAFIRNEYVESEEHLGCFASVRMAMHVLERARPQFYYVPG